MFKTQDQAITLLRAALDDYDQCKRDHKDSTDALTEAKKMVDSRARAVCDAKSTPTLFDRDDEPAATVTQSTEVDGHEARVVSPADDIAKQEVAPVIDGTTGAPIPPAHEVPAAEYPMTPSAEDPTLCVCGFAVDSPVAGALHDSRHGRYLAAFEGSGLAEATAQRPRKIREKKGDVTAAVAARAKGKARV